MGDGSLTHPPFVNYSEINQYKKHYERVYCHGPIITFDGISVRFRKIQFAHCFFESSKRNGIKDVFSEKRSKRIDWIKSTLQDPHAHLYIGWDNRRKRLDSKRRVAIVMGNYVVIIQLTSPQKAFFITAYVADSSGSLYKIKRSPRWAP